MNLSGTMFAFPPENPVHTRQLRIFTPGGAPLRRGDGSKVRARMFAPSMGIPEDPATGSAAAALAAYLAPKRS